MQVLVHRQRETDGIWKSGGAAGTAWAADAEEGRELHGEKVYLRLRFSLRSFIVIVKGAIHI